MQFGMLSVCMLIMLVSGSFNTLLMKGMVMAKTPLAMGGKAVGFDHPYFQSLLMMFGEFLCLIAYWFTTPKKDQEKTADAPKYIFAVACLCDWIATTLVNMAYVMIPASIVQMTRGAIVIFTCLLSVGFLGRRQYRCHIVGVVLVFIGITLVSLSAFTGGSAMSNAEGASGTMRLVGILMCVGAQIFQAFMIVWEERIMSKYPCPPLQVVGMEGFFGIIFGIILLVFLNIFHVEDSFGAMYQMRHNSTLMVMVIGSIFSIAFFNFSGVTVTQQASATARSTIDVSRTIIIWVVELICRWNTFSSLELVGFIVLAAGTLVYNRLITFKVLEPPDESKAMLAEESKAKEVEAA